MLLHERTVPLLLAVPVLAVSAVLPWQAGWIGVVAVIVVLGVPHGALDVEIGRNLLRSRVGTWWFPVFAVPYLLLVGAVLPWQLGWIWAVAVIVALGVPHGALDVEIGRNLLRGRFGGWWFSLFAVPYLLLVGAVLLAWRWAPEATLAAFLAASVWHFGTEDTGAGGLPALFRGGLPIAVSVLLHPQATAQVFSAVSRLPFDQPPVWLTVFAILWLIPACLVVLRSQVRDLLLPGILLLVFAVLPPLPAFALYFVAIHAPAHTAALIRHASRAPRVQDVASAWRLAVPTTVLTIAIGVALWPFYAGEAPVRLVCLTLQLLAAFTLPHMVLDAWLERQESKRSLTARGRQLVGPATRGCTRQRSTISALLMAKRPELHREVA